MWVISFLIFFTPTETYLQVIIYNKSDIKNCLKITKGKTALLVHHLCDIICFVYHPLLDTI